MTFTTVTLNLHDVGEVTIADYVDNNGKFVGIGALAACAIANRHAIHYITQAGVETFIPFHAISSVTIAKAEGEYTKPTDDFCKAMECPTTPMCDEEETEDEGEGQ